MATTKYPFGKARFGTYYGTPKSFPYVVRFDDGRVSGSFKTKRLATSLLHDKFLGGKGRIIDRRK